VGVGEQLAKMTYLKKNFKKINSNNCNIYIFSDTIINIIIYKKEYVFMFSNDILLDQLSWQIKLAYFCKENINVYIPKFISYDILGTKK
jgi:hypothetical protein